ncbi:MAG: transposase [Candidatus Paceibacterota bacterium]
MRIYDHATGKSYFQKRRKRYELEGDARDFTFSCYHRYQFLSRDRTREWFIEALASARSKYPLDLWAYVIMPEHVHLLLYPREPGLKMGPIVGEIKEEVGRKAVRYLKKHAPKWLDRITVREGKRMRHRFWQPGGGFDRNACEIETIHHMIDYIHANPVPRGLVQRAEDWYWSSAGWYVGKRPAPIEIDRTIPMYHYTVD